MENQLDSLKAALNEIEGEILDDEKEKAEIIARMPQITTRQGELDEILATLIYKRDSLEVLLSEIDKGFDKVQASVKSLYLLALSKSKILKRKHSKFN